MAEKILNTISAGRTPVYEIVESDDGIMITIRAADGSQLKLARSVLPVLAAALAKIEPFPKSK